MLTGAPSSGEDDESSDVQPSSSQEEETKQLRPGKRQKSLSNSQITNDALKEIMKFSDAILANILQFLIPSQLFRMQRINRRFCKLIQTNPLIYQQQMFDFAFESLEEGPYTTIVDKIGHLITRVQAFPLNELLEKMAVKCTNLQQVTVMGIPSILFTKLLRNCASSLQQLHVSITGDKLQADSSLVLPNLRNVGVFITSEEKILSLFQIAPRIQSLEIDLLSESIVDVISKKLTSLKAFTFHEVALNMSISHRATQIETFAIRVAPQLDKVDIASSKLNGASISLFLERGKDITSAYFVKLNFNFLEMAEDDLQLQRQVSIADFGDIVITKPSNLQNLNLRVPVSNNSFHSIYTYCTLLEKLEMRLKGYENHITDDMIISLLSCCKRLRYLVIKGQNKLSGSFLLDSVVLAHPRLVLMDISIHEYSSIYDKGQSLNVSELVQLTNSTVAFMELKAPLEDKDLKYLLSRYGSIQKIMISSSKLTSKTVKRLSKQRRIDRVMLKGAMSVTEIKKIHYNPDMKFFFIDHSSCHLDIFSFMSMQVAFPCSNANDLSDLIKFYIENYARGTTAGFEDDFVPTDRPRIDLQVFRLLWSIQEQLMQQPKFSSCHPSSSTTTSTPTDQAPASTPRSQREQARAQYEALLDAFSPSRKLTQELITTIIQSMGAVLIMVVCTIVLRKSVVGLAVREYLVEETLQSLGLQELKVALPIFKDKYPAEFELIKSSISPAKLDKEILSLFSR